MRAKIAPVIENLSDLAATIDNLREQLSLNPFELHQEFLASRGPVASSAVGEPKQAQAWIQELAERSPTNDG